VFIGRGKIIWMFDRVTHNAQTWHFSSSLN
jgi:hypothetical protein